MKMNILIILSIMLCGASCEKLVDHVYSIKIQNHYQPTKIKYLPVLSLCYSYSTICKSVFYF